jgi:hypothetical protein
VSVRWSSVRALSLSLTTVPAPRCWLFHWPPPRSAPRHAEANRIGRDLSWLHREGETREQRNIE